MKKANCKGGRPVMEAAQRQQYIVSARLDSEHYGRLRALARESGCRPSEIVRQLIGKGWVKERMRRGHLDFMTQLKGIARNLNQLTRTAHVAGYGTVAEKHSVLIQEIESFLKFLRRDR